MVFRIHIVDQDPSVREISQEYKPDDINSAETQTFFDDLIDTMIKTDGIGIAAPQVGKLVRILVVHKEYAETEDHLVLINPRVVSKSKKTSFLEEGCLSVPGKFGPVERATKIRIKGQLRDSTQTDIKAKGMFARILQHEIDHLDGILFIDKATKIEEREPDAAPSMALEL